MKLPGVTFSKDALVAFLLNHVEKIVVAVIGLLALLLAWNGISALRLKSAAADRQPQAIVALANQTMQHIDAEPNPPAEAVRRAGELATLIDPWRASQVAVAAPPEMAPLSRPTVATFTMRGEPRVLPIEDLQTVAGVAVVKDQMAEQAANAFAAPPSVDPSGMQSATESGNPDYDEPVKRFEKLVPCVVLVGLVPAAKQRAEFRTALGSQTDDAALGQQVDVPRWGDFVVERTMADAEDWRPIRPRLVGDQAGSKPIPERFLLRAEELARADGQSGYVAGLPPRLYQPWGLDTIHPWFRQPQHKWRLERSEQIAESPVRLTPAEFRQQFTDHAGHEVEVTSLKFVGAPQRTGSPDSVFMNVASDDGKETFPPPDPVASGATPVGAVTTVAPKPVFVMASDWQKRLDMRGVAACTLRVVPAIDGGVAVAQIVGITPLDENGTPGVEQRDPRGTPAGGIGPGFGPGGEGAMPPPMMAGGGPDEGAEYRLFRFVDDTVEFGKAYRYRVKLELVNPNWGLDPKLLASPKSAETELLSAESASSAPVLVPAPYVMVARDAIDGGAPATPSPDDSGAETKKPVGPKPLQLGKTQVEVSFVGPTWRHMRGKRPEQGYDYFDYAIEHVMPLEPGNAVLWKRSRKAKAREKTKSDARATKAADKPRPTDPTWSLLTTADVGRDVLDFRGRQASDAGGDGGRKEAAAIPEPVELALLRSDGSLEVVTAADSQQLLDAFQDSVDGMPTPMGPGMGPPGREGPRYDRPVP
jgi:hypothetical protein